MANKRVRNLLTQAVPVEFVDDAQGNLALRMFSSRESLVMDEDRVSQNILDLVTAGYFSSATTTDSPADGFGDFV